MRRVKSVTRHERFNKNTMDFDIAIIELDEPVQFSDHIAPICLPDEPVSGKEPVLVSGWGESEDTMDENYLNQAYVAVIARDTCNLPEWYDGRITENMICAGN